MRSAILAIIFSSFAQLWTESSSGMDFSKVAIRGGIAIEARGIIEIGDAAKFQRIFLEATADEKGLRRIILQSPGGNVVEAMRVAAIIRANNFMTLVTGECASACAMILYPAGVYFVLLDGGKLGFHTCYDGRNLTEYPECTEGIANLAAENGFPHGSIKIFAGLAGPTDMYWISNVLAYCYGMEHFVGTPAPVTIQNICPTIAFTLITGNSREAGRALGPSFDCSKASTPIEHLLCRDRELMHLDALMGELYRMLRQREDPSKTTLLLTQRTWILERDKKCPVSLDIVSSAEKSRDAARCISEMTMARMDKLLEANGTPRRTLIDLIKKIE
jgi:uncharacterized protein YecT (DUF1311 family)